MKTATPMKQFRVRCPNIDKPVTHLYAKTPLGRYACTCGTVFDELPVVATTFESLPVGARFRWVIPPLWGDGCLDGVHYKGGKKSFGPEADWQPWEVTHERDWEVEEQP